MLRTPDRGSGAEPKLSLQPLKPDPDRSERGALLELESSNLDASRRNMFCLQMGVGLVFVVLTVLSAVAVAMIGGVSSDLHALSKITKQDAELGVALQQQVKNVETITTATLADEVTLVQALIGKSPSGNLATHVTYANSDVVSSLTAVMQRVQTTMGLATSTAVLPLATSAGLTTAVFPLATSAELATAVLPLATSAGITTAQNTLDAIRIVIGEAPTPPSPPADTPPAGGRRLQSGGSAAATGLTLHDVSAAIQGDIGTQYVPGSTTKAATPATGLFEKIQNMLNVGVYDNAVRNYASLTAAMNNGVTTTLHPTTSLALANKLDDSASLVDFSLSSMNNKLAGGTSLYQLLWPVALSPRDSDDGCTSDLCRLSTSSKRLTQFVASMVRSVTLNDDVAPSVDYTVSTADIDELLLNQAGMFYQGLWQSLDKSTDKSLITGFHDVGEFFNHQKIPAFAYTLTRTANCGPTLSKMELACATPTSSDFPDFKTYLSTGGRFIQGSSPKAVWFANDYNQLPNGLKPLALAVGGPTSGLLLANNVFVKAATYTLKSGIESLMQGGEYMESFDATDYPTAETYDHTSAKWKCSDFYTEGNPQSFFELETSGTGISCEIDWGEILDFSSAQYYSSLTSGESTQYPDSSMIKVKITMKDPAPQYIQTQGSNADGFFNTFGWATIDTTSPAISTATDWHAVQSVSPVKANTVFSLVYALLINAAGTTAAEQVTLSNSICHWMRAQTPTGQQKPTCGTGTAPAATLKTFEIETPANPPPSSYGYYAGNYVFAATGSDAQPAAETSPTGTATNAFTSAWAIANSQGQMDFKMPTLPLGNYVVQAPADYSLTRTLTAEGVTEADPGYLKLNIKAGALYKQYAPTTLVKNTVYLNAPHYRLLASATGDIPELPSPATTVTWTGTQVAAG